VFILLKFSSLMFELVKSNLREKSHAKIRWLELLVKLKDVTHVQLRKHFKGGGWGGGLQLETRFFKTCYNVREEEKDVLSSAAVIWVVMQHWYMSAKSCFSFSKEFVLTTVSHLWPESHHCYWIDINRVSIEILVNWWAICHNHPV